MRHYETDSSPAAARLLALTALADGGLDRNELDAMMQAHSKSPHLRQTACPAFCNF